MESCIRQCSYHTSVWACSNRQYHWLVLSIPIGTSTLLLGQLIQSLLWLTSLSLKAKKYKWKYHIWLYLFSRGQMLFQFATILDRIVTKNLNCPSRPCDKVETWHCAPCHLTTPPTLKGGADPYLPPSREEYRFAESAFQNLSIEGIFSDSNSFNLWHEPEDIHKKSLFPNFQLIPILPLQVNFTFT